MHTDWPRGSVAQPPNRRTDLQVPRKLQNYAAPRPIRIVQPGIHNASGLGCDLFDRLHVDRQFRARYLSELHRVETDEGDIPPEAQPRVVQGGHGAYGQVVVPGEHRSGARVCREQSHHRRISVLHVQRGALDMVFGDCDAGSASRCEEAVKPALQAPHFFLQAPGSRTIPVGLLDFKGQFASNTGAIFAGLTLATIPLIIVYLVFNRTITKGVALGGVFR